MVCFVPGCKSGNNSSKTHLFKFPSKGNEDLRKLWLSNIPKRADTKWDFKKSFLCYLHFEEKFLVKESTVKMNGVVIASQPRKNWTLTIDAVPTKFSNIILPKYFDKQLNKRKMPADRTVIATKRHKQKDYEDSEDSVTLSSTAEIEEPCFNIGYLIMNKTFIELPSDCWIIQTNKINQPTITVSKLKVKQEMPELLYKERHVVIAENLRAQVFVSGVDVTKHFESKIDSFDSINSLIKALENTQICGGISNYLTIKSCISGVKKGNLWFSKKCEIISHAILCVPCSKFKKYLSDLRNRRKRKTEYENTKSIQNIKYLKEKLRNSKNHIEMLQRRMASRKIAVSLLKTKLKRNTEVSLVNAINNENRIPMNMKLGMVSAVKLAKAKSAKGHRYEADWLLQCLLLKVKSPKAYRYLRENEILPLPHPSTLSKLIGSIPCEFGFTDFVFKEIENQNSGKTQRDRQVMLLFDEMKVKEELDFSKLNMHFQGFINYAEFTEDYLRKSKKPSQIADHALVLVARSVNASWVQPLACFASRGAAPGSILAKILLSCIIKLENAKCEVLGVACDGASTNKSLWNIMGIKGKFGNVNNKIQHPCADCRYLYFISDVPHIFKCIRNFLKNHGIKKFKAKQVNWGHYQTVYDEEMKTTLRVVPKLSPAHLNPNSFQKMRVYLATQIFSRTMADGIQFYREYNKVQLLLGSETTEHFTRSLNDLFDSLNASRPIKGITVNSDAYNTISKFIKLLNENENDNDFASLKTLESLRVTLQSIKEIIEYLSNLGFKYVLTAKLNQDCVEKIFGLIRSMGGDDHHPTVTSFLHIYRLLCLYSPVARTLRGNVRTQEECPVAIVNYVELLRTKKKAVSHKNLLVKSHYEEILLKAIKENREFKTLVDFNQDYPRASSQNCVVYHLAGFVALKAKNFTDCEKCMQSLVSSNCPTASYGFYSKLKFLGGLTFPSCQLYNLINKYVEPSIANHLQASDLMGDIFQSIVSSIEILPKYKLGCEVTGHSESLIVQIVMYYITIRMYFYARILNKENLSSGNKCKQKMKEAKLS